MRPASQRTTSTGCAMPCQMATFFSDRNSKATPFFEFNSQSRLLAFHFEATAGTGVATGAGAGAAAATGAGFAIATGAGVGTGTGAAAGAGTVAGRAAGADAAGEPAGTVVVGAVAGVVAAGAAVAAGFGGAGFGAAGLRAAAGTATGTAGADDRNIAYDSEPPATTRSAARAMRRCELLIGAVLDVGGGITGAATCWANSGAAVTSNSVTEDAGVSIDASKFPAVAMSAA